MRTGATILAKCKAEIQRDLDREKIKEALQLTHMASRLLYVENQCFVDEDLESWIRQIAEILAPVDQTEFDPETVLFYDGFGYNSRGLAQIYLKALTKTMWYIFAMNRRKIGFRIYWRFCPGIRLFI